MTVDERGAATVIGLFGRLTIGPGLDELRRVVDVLIAGGRRALVVDLDGLDFIESAGLGELVACRRLARERGGRLVLARPRGKVRDVLQLTRIHQMVRTFDDLAAAVAAATGGDE